MSKREQRREQGSGWANVDIKSMSPEEFMAAGQGIQIREPEPPKTALVQQDDGTWLLFNSIELTKTGLKVPSNFSEADRDMLGHILVGMQESTQFWMGDWANLYITDEMNDIQRGQKYDSLAETFNVENKALRTYASVCRILPVIDGGVSLRRDTLTYSHHKEIAFLPEVLKGQEEYFLDAAVEGNWSVRQLREEIHKAANEPQRMPSAIVVDVANIAKQMRELANVLNTDISLLKPKKRNEYRGTIAVLRRLLTEIEAKLDTKPGLSHDVD